jgi:hypothetical protein
MGDVIHIEAKQPHMTIPAIDKKIHVVPVSLIKDIIDGRKSITDLDGFEEIVPTIIEEWFQFYNE